MANARTMNEKRDVKALFDRGSRNDKVQVSTVVREGANSVWVDIRTMWTPEGSEEIRPTLKGLRFNADKITDMIEALNAIKADIDNGVYAVKEAPVEEATEATPTENAE